MGNGLKTTRDAEDCTITGLESHNNRTQMLF